MPIDSFSSDIRRIAEQLYREEPVSAHVLADELETYAQVLSRKHNSEFVDLDTANQVVALCRRLLGALPVDPSEKQHRLTQLAISYFVLEEDIDDDNASVVGFDDDLQVVVAVIKELGLHGLLKSESMQVEPN